MLLSTLSMGIQWATAPCDQNGFELHLPQFVHFWTVYFNICGVFSIFSMESVRTEDRSKDAARSRVTIEPYVDPMHCVGEVCCRGHYLCHTRLLFRQEIKRTLDERENSHEYVHHAVDMEVWQCQTCLQNLWNYTSDPSMTTETIGTSGDDNFADYDPTAPRRLVYHVTNVPSAQPLSNPEDLRRWCGSRLRFRLCVTGQHFLVSIVCCMVVACIKPDHPFSSTISNNDDARGLLQIFASVFFAPFAWWLASFSMPFENNLSRNPFPVSSGTISKPRACSHTTDIEEPYPGPALEWDTCGSSIMDAQNGGAWCTPLYGFSTKWGAILVYTVCSVVARRCGNGHYTFKFKETWHVSNKFPDLELRS